MPIQEQNIVFVESQVMDDVPEGGGAATGRVIVDGQMNNVFEDISDLDRALGRFNLRKLFLAVRTLSTDLFGGAKSVITQLPIDDAIGYTLFSSNNPFDTRAEAVGNVESYLFKSVSWPGHLLENHIAGMMSINVIQRVGTAIPPIGKTLALVQNEGLGNEIEQYVRVVDVDVVETTFTDNQGDFVRWVVTLSISDQLRDNFDGHTPQRFDSAFNFTNRTRIRDTTVADATRYYGSQKLKNPASIGDLSVRANSMFTQLVPSAQTETPLVEQPLNPEIVFSIDAGARTVDAPQQAHTLARPVTVENRRFNWIETLAPIPAPGAFAISYMAQGNWFTLTASEDGTIAGSDPGFGAGTLNYATGSMSVTLGALPDAESQIIMVWGSPVHYQVYVGDPDIDTTVEVFHEVGEPIKPGTLVLTWLVNAVVKTATAAINGDITGDATGYCSHGSGEILLFLSTPPDFNSQLGIDYESNPQQQQTFTGVSAPSGLASVSVGEAVEQGSVVAKWVTESKKVRDSTRTDAGKFRPLPGGGFHNIRTVIDTSSTTRRIAYSAPDYNGEIVDDTGSVNYATGAMVIPVLPAVTESAWSNTFSDWFTTSGSDLHTFTGVINVWYTPAGVGSAVVSKEIDFPPLQFRVLPRLIADRVVPNSLRFTWNGKTFDDRNGTIYTDIDPQTGAGTPAGTIDYLSGIVELTFYASGAGAVNITSLLGIFGDWHTIEAFFRTPLSPLKPESLQVVAVALDGEQLIAIADQDGNFTHEFIQGTVNYNFGTAALTFGKLVADASLSPEEKAEDWYDPENVVDGMIYKPRPMAPSTIKYNAVSFKYLPLPSDIIGVDAVRLPADGRVPIFRPGDVVMVMHPDETAPVTVVNDDTINVGRTRIAWIRVIDADGVSHGEGYELDRAAGIVTFTDVSEMTMPIKIRHTVGDLRMITDAQINGELTLSRPLTHNYPANESIVGSALLHGDRRARVSHVWDQSSWNGTWVDFLIGSEATATLDVIAHPIEVTNEGAETERWILRWTSTTNVELIGQRRGLVFSGPFNADIAPINPRTRVFDEQTGQMIGGVPYLLIPLAANGGGWSTGNVVRINTVGAIADIWMARAIMQSDPPLDDGVDGSELYALGNIDNPVQ